MGSFTSTTPGTRDTKAAPAASSHADQIQGASVSATPLAPAPASTPVYSHADQIMGASIMPGDQPGFRIDPVDFPDPSNSPWLNPPAMNANVLNPFGGTGGTGATAASAAPGGGNLPAPPPLPQKPAPASTPKSGLTGRVPGTGGETPIYRPNEIEGGGNTKESAAYVQKKNADAAKLAETEARVEAHHAEERAKVARERQKTAEKVQRWHAEEIADAQKAQIAQHQKLAKALTTKVRQVMEHAGHPGISDDAKIVQEARRAPLTAEAAASNDRQVKALGRIGGVGDLPVYTADAAENYGDKGIHEVADLIHRTAATDPDQGKALLDQTTVRMSDAKADRLRQTVASYKLDDESGDQKTVDTEVSKPVVNKADDRIRSILDDTVSIFEISENPDAESTDTWYTSNVAGKSAVANYNDIIKSVAAREGVDPDLLRAVVYAENARGHYFGAAKAAEGLSLADSIFPMNLNPKIWSELGIDQRSALDPEVNIRTGARLLKRIEQRIVDPTPSKVASVWNFAGREKVNDFGAYVGHIYRSRPWER